MWKNIPTSLIVCNAVTTVIAIFCLIWIGLQIVG